MTPTARYVLRESLVAAAVSGVLSAVFALAALHGRPALPFWGWGGVAADFAPQAFFMIAATTVGVTLVTCRRTAAGAAPRRLRAARPRAFTLPRHVVARAGLFGLACTLVATPLSILVMAALGAPALSAGAFVAFKMLYGAGLTLLVAPPIALAALD